MLDAPSRRNEPSRVPVDGPRTALDCPRATYRLQFHKDFPFSAARECVDYLHDLGISHVYSSPILSARAGSMHGYDTIDYDRINDELGGETEFLAMARAFRDAGIGIILDIVPNHMAVGGADNKLWLNLLKNGRNSPYATWFDVDFDCPDPELRGRVHAPFLGKPYKEALADGDLKLIVSPFDEALSGYAIEYGDNLFPIRPENDAEITAAGIEAFTSPAELDRLISEQNFLLDWWRNAGDRINWRRFFDITQLAAVRMEVPAAFSAKHAIPLRLYRDGIIDGLRIDHVDGLADPAGYCQELRRQLDDLQPHRPDGLGRKRAYLVVEKILASGEALPVAWDVEGSTGYDFMNEVNALQHDRRAEALLSEHWSALSGRSRDFHAEEEIARHQIIEFSFDGQRSRLIDLLQKAGAEGREGFGLTRAALRRSVTSLIAELRAYRSYATGRDDGASAGERFAAALDLALSAPLSDKAALNFIASIMAGDGAESLREVRIEAIRRFNQLSAPLAAKAVEDTAFYRYGRLLSRNDVGFDAETLGQEPDQFHDLMHIRVRNVPNALLATATHDHKRGEDVRARLAVISEVPHDFIVATRRWHQLTSAFRPASLDAGDEYMIYQMIVGAWAFGLASDDADGLKAYAERLNGWARKALREGKLRSSWAAPNEPYEADVTGFIAHILTPSIARDVLGDIAAFVARIGPAGAANGLTQMALRLTAPGVPDTYQGTEFWDFSFVDPDNRRPVDFAVRAAAISAAKPLDQLAASWRDGRIKQAIMRRLLAFRAAEPELFEVGSYEPLEVTGPRGRNGVAFLRRHADRAMLVVVGRLLADGLQSGNLVPDAQWWGDTAITGLPPMSDCTTVIGPDWAAKPSLPVSQALLSMPVAVWSLRLT